MIESISKCPRCGKELQACVDINLSIVVVWLSCSNCEYVTEANFLDRGDFIDYDEGEDEEE